jgi:nitrite reductase/ring-hydroxylating ferredoxin subunit
LKINPLIKKLVVYKFKYVLGAQMRKTGKTIVIIFSLCLIIFTISACGSSSQSSQAIKASWIQPLITSDIVSVPVSLIEKDVITHFKVNSSEKELTFMSYEYAGQIYTRADICPPCRSINFSLKEGILVCDTCGSTFDAKTGAGVGGACRAYSKALTNYELKDGNIMLKVTDLAASFQKTLNP